MIIKIKPVNAKVNLSRENQEQQEDSLKWEIMFQI